MMRPLSRTVLFSLLAAGMLPLTPFSSAQDTNNQSVSEQTTENVEASRRRIAVRDAMLQVQAARSAYAAGRYTEAEEHYRNALAVIPDAPATARQVKFIRTSLADALIAKAMDYGKVGRYDEACDFLREAIKLDPESNRAQLELSRMQDPIRHNPALTPKHVADVNEVQRLLELGHGQIGLGLYDAAITSFRAVLEIDPYNSAARRGMENAEERRRAHMKAARNAMRSKMLSDVDAELEEPVPDPEALPDVGAVDEAVSPVDAEVKRDFAARLEEMVMPSIVFDGASIDEVVEALQNQILRFEAAQTGPGHRHINLVKNFGAPDSAAYKDLKAQEIRLNLSEVSVKDILDLLVQQLDIQYFYTDLGVQLCLGGRDFGPMMDRVFVVPPHFFDPDKRDADDDDSGFAADSVKVKRVNPKDALKKMGVTFPEGSNISYSPSRRLLRVRNTMQNLQDIETILDVPMEKDAQVVLSVVAVEVSQNDLEQMGFDWLFDFGVGKRTFMSGGLERKLASGATGVPVITAELGSKVSPAMTSGLRDAGTLVTSNSMESLIEQGSVPAYHSRSSGSPSIFGVRGVWNVADVSFVMKGLAQKKGVDVLQNPKLVFSPGNDEQVSIGCVDEMYFPQTWEAGDIQAANNNRNNDFSYSPIASGSHPTDFERMGCEEDNLDGLGTILMVHSAELEETAQGNFINISLTTIVKEFEGFINWGSPINSVVINNQDDVKYIELTPNYILQPMIKRRLENTRIRIAPGSVLVIGGLKESQSVQFEDKVPIMGDLPMVGRLFRSSGESKLRKALIFFVKVDYVDPTGRDVTTGKRPSIE